MTLPYNLDIKCQSNSENYDQHGFFGTKFRGGQNFLLTVGGFYNEREYSGADWLVLLVLNRNNNQAKQNTISATDTALYLQLTKVLSLQSTKHYVCNTRNIISAIHKELFLQLPMQHLVDHYATCTVSCGQFIC